MRVMVHNDEDRCHNCKSIVSIVMINSKRNGQYYVANIGEARFIGDQLLINDPGIW